ncbi:tyrosine-type recombinase/integrase [Burkholderia multivorans]|uniref:tyrosine-type recombinase/integrase n=1 Tax=Burkholderia cepacia complex TaxID=87882 RepID=UPI001C22C57D|nr:MULTISPECIES: tyrosine-type recombinase/integrase [Burkholderia cepacia complex]MBU9236600.1 tyrosine-type recombinase/integrase [Burkholderia multivorans]MCO1362880.1 tyrosine-type recombinase/integrase [Burkholderia multivorans]MCO1422765.1 tyrosine-type recombinase/integrase [Burkholderia multivorans]MDC6086691.1 tyrosine-type recombinase/integrase [Burkholderia cenocepacia]UQO98750.1 tyrosine-type recombinase/integrase [Burkholderia multivorans]
MAKAPVIEERQLRHMLKVAAVTGESPLRDVALLYVLYGTGMMLTELASLTVRDYLLESGLVRKESAIRAAIAHNGRERPIFWVNVKVVGALDAYLAYRVVQRHGVTTRKTAFRGLDPDGPLFLRADGEPYRLTARRSATGTVCYSCDALSQVFRRLHAQAGIEGGHALAGRRTFSVRMHRKGFDLRHISELLGHGTLTATKRLIDSDPVALGELVERIL